MLVVDEEGIEPLISELLKAANDSQVLLNKLSRPSTHFFPS